MKIKRNKLKIARYNKNTQEYNLLRKNKIFMYISQAYMYYCKEKLNINAKKRKHAQYNK